jgi:hypothetical protein
MSKIDEAFGCENTQNALQAYASIRAAIVLPDEMSDEALRALQRRVAIASRKYAEAEGRSNACLCVCLEAYEAYIAAVLHERGSVRHADAISPDVPEGYDTLLGYLAKNHPGILDHVDYYDPTTTMHWGWELANRCRLCEEKEARYALAPDCFRDNPSIHTVRAYPLAILKWRFS